jgi:TonB family protein
MSKSALQPAPTETFPVIDRPANDARPSESLVALTHDEVLRETLTAVAPEHVLSFATDEADLTHHLRAEPAGVAFLDSAALKIPAAELTERLRGQFPDLVLIVAGGPEDQSALSHQVTNGTVYRFLHKPVSAQRVKLFVDAAWRRHDVEHAATGTFAAVKLESPFKRGILRHAPWLGLAALAAVLAGGLGFVLKHAGGVGGAGMPQPGAAATTQLLARADAALAAGALIAPPAESAADLYREVLRRDAANARAHEGLRRVADALLTSAEQALLAEKLDEAQRLTAQARSIDPDNVRIAFLTAQIAKESGPAAQSTAGASPTRGGAGRALAGVARAGATAAPAAAERLDLAARVRGFLDQADARMRDGALLAPAGSNAKFFIDAASALAPDNPAVRRAQRTLAERLVAQARAAVQSGNLADAERWTQAAGDAGARSDELAAVRRSLEDARVAAAAGARARVADLFHQRLVQGQLLEPATDSARFYLAQLESTDPSNPATGQARAALAGRLLDEARGALARNDWAKAQDWLTEARVVGVSPADASAVERAVSAARENAARGSIISETALRKLRYVEPVYPPVAEQLGRSGIVEMQFTVEPNGSVGDITVTHANPPGMFDAAAIDAVRQWRYQPVERNGHPVAQRVTLRVMFKP